MFNKILTFFGNRKLFLIVAVAIALLFQNNIKFEPIPVSSFNFVSSKSFQSHVSEKTSVVIKLDEFAEIQNDIEENELESFELFDVCLNKSEVFSLGKESQLLVFKEKSRIFRKQPLYLLFCELKIHLV